MCRCSISGSDRGHRAWANRHDQGGLLVFPKSHVESLMHSPDEALAECMALAKRVAQALVASLGCEGVTLRQNNGAASGQDVWHFHIHVVPRWSGDGWGLGPQHNLPEPERAALAERIRGGFATLG